MRTLHLLWKIPTWLLGVSVKTIGLMLTDLGDWMMERSDNV